MAYVGIKNKGKLAACRVAVAKILFSWSLACLVTACGMKGDLYLPEEAPPAERTASNANSDSGSKPASGAGAFIVSSRN